ncbi:MAG: hypothetical protein ACLSDQ_09175 [Adlercreutzia equolifaciens]
MTNLTAQLEDERVIMPQASTYVRIPDDAAFRGETGPLPAGVRRVTPTPWAPSDSWTGRLRATPRKSPGGGLRFRRHVHPGQLAGHARPLPGAPAHAVTLGGGPHSQLGFAYKTRLPQNEAWVRG